MRMQGALALGTLAVSLTVVSPARATAPEPPKGWIQAGQDPADYEMAVDPTGGRNGGACAYIKAKTPEAKTFGTLMQQFDASEYKDKRLRLSAWVKSAGVRKWAGLWMRIDGPPDGRGFPAALGFDNMQNRPIKGTTDWTRYEVVLDVTKQAVAVNFGILLSGAGQAWLDGVAFDVVGPEVPVTDFHGTLPKQPVNLDFEQH
jgi:hypothetical protein